MQTRINFAEYGQQQLALMDLIRSGKLPTFYRSLYPSQVESGAYKICMVYVGNPAGQDGYQPYPPFFRKGATTCRLSASTGIQQM